jgi:CubicO group peptidase (beta-lactamase class C family)
MSLRGKRMMIRALLVGALCAGLLAAQGQPVPRFSDPQRRAKLMAAMPEIDKIFETLWQKRNTPGLVYGVVIDGEPVVIKAFGVRDVNSKEPVTPDTVFRIASMTKSFTALAILKLRDEGKLSLEDPVAKWIPEFAAMRYPTADSAPIRVKHLLNHGGGFPEDNPWGDRQLGIPEATMTKWLKEGIPFSTPPNTAYEYSNYGFALAGRVIAAASGMSYKDYVHKQILAPLGMTSSTLEPREVPERVRAVGYRQAESGSGFEVVPPLPHGEFGAMGGLLTSARDLAKYVAFHLAAYPARNDADNGPVRRSSLREMSTAQRPSDFRVSRTGEGELRGSSGGYGYGLSVLRDCRFEHIVGHGGGLPGFGSYMQWLPEYGVGFFAMSNLTYSGQSMAISLAFDALRKTGALEPRELAPTPELTAARDALARLYARWSDRDAERIAADNLFLDRSAESRRKEFERVRGEAGKCEPPGDVKPENWLRGHFRMNCEKGPVEIYFTLAPTRPPKVQELRIASGDAFSRPRPPCSF